MNILSISTHERGFIYPSIVISNIIAWNFQNSPGRILPSAKHNRTQKLFVGEAKPKSLHVSLDLATQLRNRAREQLYLRSKRREIITRVRLEASDICVLSPLDS